MPVRDAMIEEYEDWNFSDALELAHTKRTPWAATKTPEIGKYVFELAHGTVGKKRESILF